MMMQSEVIWELEVIYDHWSNRHRSFGSSCKHHNCTLCCFSATSGSERASIVTLTPALAALQHAILHHSSTWLEIFFERLEGLQQNHFQPFLFPTWIYGSWSNSAYLTVSCSQVLKCPRLCFNSLHIPWVGINIPYYLLSLSHLREAVNIAIKHRPVNPTWIHAGPARPHLEKGLENPFLI